MTIKTLVSKQFEIIIATSSISRKQFIESIRKRSSKQQRYYLIQKKIIVFRDLQKAFKLLIFLIHYDRKRKFYFDIDINKK